MREMMHFCLDCNGIMAHAELTLCGMYVQCSNASMLLSFALCLVFSSWYLSQEKKKSIPKINTPFPNDLLQKRS